MGVFQRLRRLISSNVNDMVQKAEDPEKMLNQLIVDMRKQLADAKRNVATAISEEKLLQRQVENQFKKVDEWEREAMTALRAGKEDLAREALQRQKRDKAYAEQLQEQHAQQREAVDKLKDSLKELQSRIEEAERKKNVLVARAKRAEAQKKIQEIITGLGDTSAFEAFDEMSKRVEQLEIQNEAIAEIDTDSSDAALRRRIADLGDGDEDQALADLREKLALEDTSSAGRSGNEGTAGSDPEVDTSLEALKQRLRDES